jgi:hypothetical protein
LPDRKFRPPNAYKHGAFSKTVLFPWEDAKEFEALSLSLEDEWKPTGALEEDAVFTILTCIWRKRRIRDKRNMGTLASMQEEELADLTAKPMPLFDTKEDKSQYVLVNRPPSSGKVRDRVTQLLGFSASLYSRLDGQFLELQISMMGHEFSDHLKQAVPRGKFATTAEWVMAIKREVDEELLPRVRAELTSPVNLAAKAAAFLTPERIFEDLALEERLDTMIDRAIRRLAQGKMMKQVAGITSNYHEAIPAAPLKIEGPKQKWPKQTRRLKKRQQH